MRVACSLYTQVYNYVYIHILNVLLDKNDSKKQDIIKIRHSQKCSEIKKKNKIKLKG